MDRFIPREKLGKKARKKLDAQKRATWSFSPTTKRVESKKRYNRKNHEPMDCGDVVFSCRRGIKNRFHFESDAWRKRRRRMCRCNVPL